MSDTTRRDIGTMYVASVNEVQGEAYLVIRGTDGVVSVEIPEDKVSPFKETVNELDHVYTDDEPEDSLVG